MIFSITVFFAVLFLLLSSFCKSKLVNTSFSSLGVFLYSSLVALRGTSGSDTFVYVYVYERINTSFLYPFYEPGVKILFQLMSYLNFPYEFVNFFQAVLVFISLTYLVWNKSAFVVVLYIFFVGLNVDFSTLRQSISMHVFVVLIYSFRNQLFATVLAGLFHLASLFSYIVRISTTRINLFKLIVLFVFLVFFKFMFLDRYLSDGQSFIFRSDFGFLLQSLMLISVMTLMGYSRRVLLCVFFLSFIPIGYRLVFFFLVLSPAERPRVGLNKVVLSFVLLFVVALKLYSFSLQSIENDGVNSVVLFYDNYFGAI